MQAGQALGREVSTGRTTGAHLHGMSVNPRKIHQRKPLVDYTISCITSL
ncbi:hypothetical protein BH23PAT2_BH23PAT2_08880 [soil metagenome]